MKNRFYLFLCLAGLLTLVACSKDDEPYPALITEMAMSSSDAQCMFTTFTTDGGRTFQMSNTIKGPTPNVRWRFLCGYVPESETTAHVYTFIHIPLLADYSPTKQNHHDPTGFASIWKSGGYLNLHLLPKTQGGKQAWGFLRDSTHVNDAGGTNHYLSLFHHQMADVAAYSDDLYVSIDLDSISASRQPEDSIILSINTFSGWRSWSYTAQD